MAESGAAYVYRLFDSAGDLLYIGLTGTIARIDRHVRSKEWGSEIASVRMIRYESRVLAAKVERQAIQAESPRYNVAFTRILGVSRIRVDRRTAQQQTASRHARRQPVWMYARMRYPFLKDFTRDLAYTVQYVCRVRSGIYEPTAEFRRRCSAVLGRPVAELFDDATETGPTVAAQEP